MTIDIPGADVKKGLDIDDDDIGVYVKILSSYVKHTPALLEKLKVISDETMTTYIAAVHTIKGSSGSIGADEIKKTAMELEALAKAGDIAGVKALNGKLVQSTETLLSNIQAWLKKNGGAG
ncbi:MAG: Hpt domain-containing protein [Spirochaetes bacterium]|nr:Hpt domain-containing protein [Spirochaetota bacterium]